MNIKVKKMNHLFVSNDSLLKYEYFMLQVGDKVIVKYQGKVMQGELLCIGEKYLNILTAPRFRCKHTCYQPNNKLVIDQIESIRKFPTGSQTLGTVECNTKLAS